MSNTFIQQETELLDLTLALRHQLLDILSNADLAYKLPNNALKLGALCREMAEFEHIYIESFKTFKMDWSYKAPNAAALESKVEVLRQIFAEQEQAFKAALSALSDETINTQTVDRGGFEPTIRAQFHVYREALLIFYAKVSIYLRALGKEFPEQWRYWIG
jgi:uncharacterized damage-inducible protein DinB